MITIARSVDDQRPHPKVGKLSPKETEAAWLLNQGLGVKAIARRLGVRPRTVETFIHTATEKLGYDGHRQLKLALYVERNKPRFRQLFGVPRRAQSSDREDRTPTPRESEIAKLVYEGFIYDEVAAKLGISVKTVKVHMNHLAAKVGGRGSPLVRAVRWWASERGRDS